MFFSPFTSVKEVKGFEELKGVMELKELVAPNSFEIVKYETVEGWKQHVAPLKSLQQIKGNEGVEGFGVPSIPLQMAIVQEWRRLKDLVPLKAFDVFMFEELTEMTELKEYNFLTLTESPFGKIAIPSLLAVPPKRN